MAEPDEADSPPTEKWSGLEGAADAAPIPRFSESAMEGMFAAHSPRARQGWQPPTPEELEECLPQYEIKELLGRGGMGAVYKGWQRSLDRFVAIKILPPDLSGEDTDFASRFKREAKAMARLKHPGIIPVHDAGESADGLLYFVMDYVEGTDVQKLAVEKGRLPADQALTISMKVLEALAYAHEHGIIHRDIKPANIMLDNEGRVHVADFGLARSTLGDSTMLTGSHVSMGTPDFMAPESRLGTSQVDHRADLYAVGVMLYRMLTGKLPHGRFEAPSRAVPGLDKRLDRIVDRALQPELTARYGSAAEFRADLESVLARLATRRPPRTPAPAKGRALYFALGVAVIVLTGAAWALLRPKARMADVPPPVDAAPAAVAPLEPGAIRLWTSPENVALGKGVQWENNALKLDKASLYTVGVTHRDAILRASIRANPDAEGPTMGLRTQFRPGTGIHDCYSVVWDLANKQLRLYAIRDNNGGQPLKVWLLPRTYAPDEWMRLELRTVGDAITVSVDGKELGTVHDSSQSGAGGGIVGATAKGYFRDVVYIPLDESARGAPAVALEPGAVKLWDKPEGVPTAKGIAWESNALRLDNASPHAFGSSHDALIRASIRMNADVDGAGLSLRHRYLSTGQEAYLVGLDPKRKAIRLRSMHGTGDSPLLGEWPLTRTYGNDEWMQMELRVVGHEITVSVDGLVYGTVRDDSQPEAGGATVHAAAKGYFRDIVYVPLDKAADGSPAASPEPSAIRLWDKPEKIPLAKGITWENDAMRLDNAGPQSDASSRDGVLRASVLANQDVKSAVLALRVVPNSLTQYRLSLGRAQPSSARLVLVLRTDSHGGLELGRWPLPRDYAPSEWIRLELRVVGEEISISVDGQVVGTVHDGSIREAGKAMLYSGGHGYFRDIVYVPLDKVAAGSPPPATPEPAKKAP